MKKEERAKEKNEKGKRLNRAIDYIFLLKEQSYHKFSTF